MLFLSLEENANMTTLTVIGFLLIIETILTVAMMEQIIKALLSLPGKFTRQWMFRAVNNVIVAFMLDTAVSYFMSSFTGSSIIAGTANLAASVIVAAVLPKRIRKKYGHLVETGIDRNVVQN